MNDMRVLGVGMVPSEATSGIYTEGARSASRLLSADCYAPLVEACAHAGAWEKAIKAFREGFGVGQEVKAVGYRVSTNVIATIGGCYHELGRNIDAIIREFCWTS